MRQHFAIGLPVRVPEDAKPAGEDERPADVEAYRSYQIQGVGEDGTFEVMGWFWNGEDLEVAW